MCAGMSKPGACAARTAADAGLFRYFRRPEPPPPPPPKPGRPPGSLNARRGPRSAQPAPTPAQPAPTPVQVSQEDCPAKKIPTPPAAQTPEVKLNSPACTRVNYSTGEALCRMQTAVDDWLEKKGVYLREERASGKDPTYTGRVKPPQFAEDGCVRWTCRPNLPVVFVCTRGPITHRVCELQRASGKDRTCTGHVKSHVCNSSYS